MTDLFEILEKGIFHMKGAASFGKQDLGYSPDGALDQFSLTTGNILLENDPSSSALEIVLPPRLRFKKDCYFTLTGGRLAGVTLEHKGSREGIDHARVYFAPGRSTLSFGKRVYGFRTYLCFRIAEKPGESIVGRTRGDFRKVFRWPDQSHKIRVMEGPEYRFLKNPEEFLRSSWQVTTDISDMALRLTREGKPPRVTLQNMVSAPVNDGTVQLTPSGPIVLLRQRQTVGGYPRILNVISADVDLLGQYGPFQFLYFRLVTLKEAQNAVLTKKEDLDRLRRRFV